MEQQKLIIDKIDSFELKDIFECGQCFRWNKENDNSYTGVIKNGVLNVKTENNKIIFNGILNKKIDDVVFEYFDLNRDYSKIKNNLAKVDKYMKKSVEFGSGIRILNQDLFETIISFIISANNNIPRIKGIIERLCEKYGNEIFFNNKKYFLFPNVNMLENVSVQDFRNLGTGFRDIRLFETVHKILNNEVDIYNLKNLDTNSARAEILKLSGVGPKVADCILLFSDLKRFDVFPIDVWVRRIMNKLYINNPDESKVSKKEISSLAFEKFGAFEGLAQQYLFYYARENEI